MLRCRGWLCAADGQQSRACQNLYGTPARRRRCARAAGASVLLQRASTRARTALQHEADATSTHTSCCDMSDAQQLPAARRAMMDFERRSWPWRHGANITYLVAGEAGPPLLLVHGFGVGAYHYERLIGRLASRHRVYAVDLLGQGSSFPERDPQPGDGPLRFSVATWTQQLESFMSDVIGEQAYVVGNSLGGYLALNLAATRSHCVRGLVLLNATPFWAFAPALEEASTSLASSKTAVAAAAAAANEDAGRHRWWPLPDGQVPAPPRLKRVVEQLWWNKLRSPQTVRSMLQLVYARQEAVDEALVERILASAEHPRALDAFVSILLSPKTRLSFDEMLDRVECPILMAYGDSDPWVVPLWGQRLKRRAGRQAAYLELSATGHCPQHESPAAVAAAILPWVERLEREAGARGGSTAGLEGEAAAPVAVGASWTVLEDVAASSSSDSSSDGEGQGTGLRGAVVQVTHTDGSARNVFEHADQAVWRLQQAWRRFMAARAEQLQP